MRGQLPLAQFPWSPEQEAAAQQLGEAGFRAWAVRGWVDTQLEEVAP